MLTDCSLKMGITGELVRSVFSKSRSVRTHDSTVRNNAVEKKRWSSVRSYLCGDEFNSVLAEEDSASVRSSKASVTWHEVSTSILAEEDSTSVRSSFVRITQPEFSSVIAEDWASVKGSEATVIQPMAEDFRDQGDIPSKGANRELHEEKQSSTAKLFIKEDAAIVIQSAFRNFLARRQNHDMKLAANTQELMLGAGSPSKESVGTSIEVQTGNSTEVLSLHEESKAMPHRMQLHRSKTQILRLKEDWDDSTVSRNEMKMRIQNRQEATTRRERALAYAFSQQLRICSRKKQIRSDGAEPNMGRSWLERWMATRQAENSLTENLVNKQIEPPKNYQRSVVRKRLFDVAGEEKESCGSNEVSIQIDSISVTASDEMDDTRPAKSRLKAPKTVSRTVPTYQCTKAHVKVSKKDTPREKDGKYKKRKSKQSGCKGERMQGCYIASIS